MARFRGTPQALDTFLEPVVALTLAAVAVPISLVLWWFQAWWWIPVPALAAAGFHLVFFWTRADRPSELEVEGGTLTLRDALRGEPLHVSLAEVSVAMLYLRSGSRGMQAIVLLADATAPRFGVQLLVPEPTRPDHAVDLDAADARLGGQAGVLRAVTPLERAARQPFPRPPALDALLQGVPAEAWARTGLRLWQGTAPALSPFGFFVPEPDGWLVLDGTSYTLHHADGSVRHGTLTPPACTSFVRSVELMVRTPDGPEQKATPVDLLTLQLGPDVAISFPAPRAAPQFESAAPHEASFHCHAPEGAALVAHLQAVLDVAALPGPLQP